MTLNGIAARRLNSQLIGKSDFKTAAAVVEWMGAMQAQDYTMAKWAVGVRLPGSTDQQVEQAIDKGEIIRTHILRPTWHLVAAADIHWMLALSAPSVKAKMAASFRQLELSNKVLTRSQAVIEKSLEGGKHLTRQELMAGLERSGISTNDLRAAHLMFWAELEGMVCNGKRRGKQLTYALLDERVPPSTPLTREEALAALAKRYFSSHGPAMLQDFAWWSGLPAKDVRAGLSMIQSELASQKSGEQTYWFHPPLQDLPARSRSVYLLPAYDEFMISYQDRKASLSPLFTKETITINGIFKPVIALNGKIAGIWKRSFKKDSVTIQLNPFNPLSKTAKQGITSAAARYGRFLSRKPSIL